jgi:hypothetical protein
VHLQVRGGAPVRTCLPRRRDRNVAMGARIVLGTLLVLLAVISTSLEASEATSTLPPQICPPCECAGVQQTTDARTSWVTSWWFTLALWIVFGVPATCVGCLLIYRPQLRSTSQARQSPPEESAAA